MKTGYEHLKESGIPLFLIPDKIAIKMAEHHNRADPAPNGGVWEDWSLKTKWKPNLYLRAKTYKPFPGPYEDLPHSHDKSVRFGEGWGLYSAPLMPEQRLRTFRQNGNNISRGWVQFDQKIFIPSLYQKHAMIMGMAPMETLTVKAGARYAKGHTVITGLGLGYLLWLCSHRSQVKKITLIEIDKDVIEFIMPRIKPYLGEVPIKIIHGDCRKVLMDLKGDALLADHFDGFGGNSDWYRYPEDRRLHIMRSFGHIWTWG